MLKCLCLRWIFNYYCWFFTCKIILNDWIDLIECCINNIRFCNLTWKKKIYYIKIEIDVQQ